MFVLSYKACTDKIQIIIRIQLYNQIINSSSMLYYTHLKL